MLRAEDGAAGLKLAPRNIAPPEVIVAVLKFIGPFPVPVKLEKKIQFILQYSVTTAPFIV